MKSEYFEMNATVKMNREITEHDFELISPGSFSIVLNNNDVVGFDFEDWSVDFSADDNCILTLNGRNLDVRNFPDAAELTMKDFVRLKSIDDFFIFTGEEGETDLAPVELLSCCISFPEQGLSHVYIDKDICKNAKVSSCIPLEIEKGID